MDIEQIEKHIEEISEGVHDAWWLEKRKQGFHAPLLCPSGKGVKFIRYCSLCHTDMYSYCELPEHIKDYDRVTVRAVLNAIKKI